MPEKKTDVYLENIIARTLHGDWYVRARIKWQVAKDRKQKRESAWRQKALYKYFGQSEITKAELVAENECVHFPSLVWLV